MTYLEHITTYVISLLGKGVTLSSGDLDVVQRWEAAGVPAEVACRAIRREWTRQRRRSRRFSLADCRVPEGEGSGSGPLGASSWHLAPLIERLVTLGRATEDAVLVAVYRALYRHLKALPDDALSAPILARLDAFAVSELERQLPARERGRQRREAKARAKRGAGRDASQRAVEGLARALLEEQYCEVYGLTLPSDLLLSKDPDGDQAAVHRLRK